MNNNRQLQEKRLLLAAENGTTLIVEDCLWTGASVEITDEWGRTPLHLAAEGGHQSIVVVLLNAGYNVSAMDEFHRTPLHLAAEGGHDSTVDVLLKAGSNVLARDEYYRTPLHRAAKEGRDIIVEVLLKAGSNVSANDEDKRTPLHLAARNGHDHTVIVLLQAGSDVSARDKHNRIPLHLAVMCGDARTVYALLQAESDPSAIDNTGKSPLDIAIDKRRSRHLVEALMKRRRQLEEELRGLGLETRTDFLDIMKQGYYKCFWNRVYLVGPYGVGKSTLAKVLVGEPIPLNREATDGIWIYMGRAGMDVGGKKWKYFPKGNSTFEIITNMLMSVDVENYVFSSEFTAEANKTQLMPADHTTQHNVKDLEINKAEFTDNKLNQKEANIKDNKDVSTTRLEFSFSEEDYETDSIEISSSALEYEYDIEQWQCNDKTINEKELTSSVESFESYEEMKLDTHKSNLQIEIESTPTINGETSIPKIESGICISVDPKFQDVLTTGPGIAHEKNMIEKVGKIEPASDSDSCSINEQINVDDTQQRLRTEIETTVSAEDDILVKQKSNDFYYPIDQKCEDDKSTKPGISYRVCMYEREEEIEPSSDTEHFISNKQLNTDEQKQRLQIKIEPTLAVKDDSAVNKIPSDLYNPLDKRLNDIQTTETVIVHRKDMIERIEKKDPVCDLEGYASYEELNLDQIEIEANPTIKDDMSVAKIDSDPYKSVVPTFEDVLTTEQGTAHGKNMIEKEEIIKPASDADITCSISNEQINIDDIKLIHNIQIEPTLAAEGDRSVTHKSNDSYHLLDQKLRYLESTKPDISHSAGMHATEEKIEPTSDAEIIIFNEQVNTDMQYQGRQIKIEPTLAVKDDSAVNKISSDLYNPLDKRLNDIQTTENVIVHVHRKNMMERIEKKDPVCDLEGYESYEELNLDANKHNFQIDIEPTPTVKDDTSVAKIKHDPYKFVDPTFEDIFTTEPSIAHGKNMIENV